MKVVVAIDSPFAIWRIPQSHVDRLVRDFPSHTFVRADGDEAALREIADAEIAFSSQISREQLLAARQLRWIHSPAAGVGGMLYPEMVGSRVVLTNSRGMSADTMAEHVLAVTLAMFRQLPEAWRRQAAREWAQDSIGSMGNRMIAGSRVLVVGLGAIGGAIASRMARLGAVVAGIRRRAGGRELDGVSHVGPSSALADLLPSADVVVVSAPHTAETTSLIGARELARMQPHALLVNVSRGRLIDEGALVDALKSGRIGGAALDVFVEEPLPPDSPFWTLPNVLITPHTSGFRPDHWDASVEIFADNLRRFTAGEPLLNVVDKQAGY